MRGDIELLAPAGNLDCLKAAVKSGADAVYFAGKSFGARSFADNFSLEEIKEAVDYCHLRSVRTHITVNTLVSDREIPKAMEYIKFLYETGVDAVIIQDLGLLSLIRDSFPDLPVHASTQMTVHNAQGVRALEKMGVSRVVLSRELSIKEIESIKKQTSAKIEVFGHGALCMCYSGQCLFSSVLGGRSGNRGKCAQPCRLSYKINDYGEKAYYMSLKDLCSLNYLERLKEIGVSSLKIEGRMKGEEYVSRVVGIYRKYIDSGTAPSQKDLESLNRIFYRGGLTDGYLSGKQGREMFAFDKPDNPYKKQENEVYEAVDCERKLKLNCKAVLTEGECPELLVEAMGVSALIKGEKPLPKGEKRPLSKDFVTEKLSKTGGTPFELENTEVIIKGQPFMSAAEINELRRKALSEFERKFLLGTRRQGSFKLKEITSKEKGNTETILRIANYEQFAAVKTFDFAKIIAPMHIILENYEDFLPIKEKIIIEPPAILKEMPKELESLKKMGFTQLLAENIAFFEVDGFTLCGGQRLNIFNSYALNLLKEKGINCVQLSPELNLGAIRDMKKPVKAQLMVYGHQPLMISENCVIRNQENCPCENQVNYLTDRKGVRFPVMRDGKSCRSIVLNSAPTYMGDRLDAIKRSGAESLVLYFTVESGDRAKEICNIFFNKSGAIENYTRLHYGKGVL